MAKIRITPRDRPAGASRAGSVEGVGGTSQLSGSGSGSNRECGYFPQRKPIVGLMTSPGRRWVWYGGRPSLDFVNTRRNREAGRPDAGAGDRTAGDGEAEYLRGPADLAGR